MLPTTRTSRAYSLDPNKSTCLFLGKKFPCATFKGTCALKKWLFQIETNLESTSQMQMGQMQNCKMGIYVFLRQNSLSEACSQPGYPK